MNIPLDAYVIICGNKGGAFSDVVFPSVEHEMTEQELLDCNRSANSANFVTLSINMDGMRPKVEFYCFDYDDVKKYIKKSLLSKYTEFVICKVRDQMRYTPESVVTKDKRTQKK